MRMSCAFAACPGDALVRCEFCQRPLCETHRHECACPAAVTRRQSAAQQQHQDRLEATCARCNRFLPEGEKTRDYEFLGHLPMCINCGRRVCSQCRTKRTGFEALHHSRRSVVFCNAPECYPHCPICREAVLPHDEMFQCEQCGLFACLNCSRYEERVASRGEHQHLAFRCKRHAGLFSSFKRIQEREILQRR